MMDTQSDTINPSDGERFAQDLRSIREHKGVSLDDMHDLTKIPLSILSDFEVNALLGNPLFNTVYLRSLVRTYATATGIDATLALECLESATIGMYHGELEAEYLPTSDGASRRSKRSRSRDKNRNSRPASKNESSSDQDDAKPSKRSEVVARGISTVTQSPATVTTPVSSSTTGVVLPRSSVFTLLSSIAALVVLAGSAYFLWQTFSTPPSATPPSNAIAFEQEDVLSPRESTAVATPVAPKPEVGEVIAIDVLAKGGNVRPIRIRVDKDLRRPYWIPKDSVRTFEFTDQIVLEENIELISLSIGGFEYPLRLSPGRRVVISRDQVESFYEQLPSR